VRGSVAIQRNVVCEFPIAGARIAGSRQDAIIDIEAVDIDTKTIRCSAQEDLPDLSADMPDREPRMLHGETTGCNAFVGPAGRRCPDHLDTADIDVELVGGDLGQCRYDALSDLDLSRRDHHVSLRGEANPRG